ncbi:MAG TPA: HRDC domain-containing protein [Gemmatimonadaceae bacterium]|nr:HRDC domain-containing protein [Gemmatimonadaceae bacterium]
MGERRRPDGTPITYLDADRDVAGFFRGIGGTRELAVDTEGASFHRFVDRVYLIQVSTRDQHAVIDPLTISAPDSLGAMLTDTNVEVVFHDADYDLRLLRQDYGWQVRRIFDTRVAAQLAGIRQFGLAALLDANFGVKLDKKHQRADWSMRPLRDDMLTYAVQDTMHLLALRDVLRDTLAKRGRSAWAAEEFERLETIERSTDGAAEAFLKIKGARDLSRRELAVLREVFRWRDSIAAELDRATFRVLGNEPMLDIARAVPSTVETLRAIKGVPQGMSPERTAGLLAAVQRGLEVPDSELPKFPRGPRWDRDPDFDTRVNALRTARDEIATQLDLDPGVLCSRERLEAVARKKPRSAEELAAIPELRRWQVEVLGSALLRGLANH